jgi:uncharacterized protein
MGNMQESWLYGLAGGGLIGVAAALYLLVNGRIMGASGILGELVDGSAGNSFAEKLAFLVALVGVPSIILVLQPAAFAGLSTHLNPLMTPVIAGGLLVGIGTRLAKGCTSGHGVCGISRLSPRSIAATIVYVGIGMATLGLIRHVWGLV